MDSSSVKDRSVTKSSSKHKLLDSGDVAKHQVMSPSLHASITKRQIKRRRLFYASQNSSNNRSSAEIKHTDKELPRSANRHLTLNRYVKRKRLFDSTENSPRASAEKCVSGNIRDKPEEIEDKSRTIVSHNTNKNARQHDKETSVPRNNEEKSRETENENSKATVNPATSDKTEALSKEKCHSDQCKFSEGTGTKNSVQVQVDMQTRPSTVTLEENTQNRGINSAEQNVRKMMINSATSTILSNTQHTIAPSCCEATMLENNLTKITSSFESTVGASINCLTKPISFRGIVDKFRGRIDHDFNPENLIPRRVIKEILARDVSEKVMQSFAAEMNISETAYIQHDADGSFKNSENFKIRWFTPTNEVPLCGHATLAASAVIFSECENVNNEITFNSLSGILKAKKENGAVTLNFPKNEPQPVDTQPWLPFLKAVLGKAVPDIDEVLIAEKAQVMLVVLNANHTSSNLQSVSPDFGKMLENHNGSTVRGVIVSAKGSGQYDFISRYFAPWVGIPEDPVTGSAHTISGPYWSKILRKSSLNARQCSQRTGDLKVVVGDDRVFLTGFSTIVVKGTANLPLD